jgi:hypothetical protein
MTRSWFPRSLSAAARRTFFSLAAGLSRGLWVDTHQDGGNTPYEVVVARVTAYRPGTQVPAEREVLVARVYDEAFGTSQREDTFTATFEGRTFDFTLRGVSSSGGCAAVGPTSPRP